MNRRNFCRIAAAAATMPALPRAQQSGAAKSFDKYTQDYAAFCAAPEHERVFYALDGGRIVGEKLNEDGWKATAWGEAPKLPVPNGSWDGVPMDSPIPGLGGEGPYKPTWDSLLQYDVPEWYRDAKFGIWAHWSPQCVPEAGDWYARNMYLENSPDYKYHLEHYGHPSKFGYKDLCAQWTLLNWHPDELIQRYKNAGARIFFTLANHHDGFDAWDSKHHPWNAVNSGPHRDVVGTWAAAARRHGLRFGVTVHQARNWWWFQTAHGADKSGPLAGVPYDGKMTATDGKDAWWAGLDPQCLYAPKHPENALPDVSYVKDFYDRTRDLIDQHDPDLLYFDNSLFPLGWGGMNIASYYYNHNLKTHDGRMEAVANIKQVPDHLAKAVVADYERGLTGGIMPYPWQSETCLGQWHYRRSLVEEPGEYGGYMEPRDILHWMIDTVSKNGTFILNVPGKPDGTIDHKEIAILDQIAGWMQINGEAIYEARPWKVYGEGPNAVKSGSFQGNSVHNLGPKDIRFTRNKANTVIYAIVLGWPSDAFVIESLGLSAATQPAKIANVRLLGSGENLTWEQTAAGLRVQLPWQESPAMDYAAALKLFLA
ncbi:MAG: alpha-L-fucosidase [Bryobacteraceae bacterium]